MCLLTVPNVSVNLNNNPGWEWGGGNIVLKKWSVCEITQDCLKDSTFGQSCMCFFLGVCFSDQSDWFTNMIDGYACPPPALGQTPEILAWSCFPTLSHSCPDSLFTYLTRSTTEQQVTMANVHPECLWGSLPVPPSFCCIPPYIQVASLSSHQFYLMMNVT